jgi:hypothetical protein
MDSTKLLCVCGNTAITTIVHIPACANCFKKYQIEGRKYLPADERVFFNDFLEKAENQQEQTWNTKQPQL